MSIYNVYETMKQLTIGGWVSIFVLVSLFIEITPLKINPIGWLGKRLNATVYAKVGVIEAKVDEHIAQSYRNKILMFQDSLLQSGPSNFTQEQYDEVIEAISNYETYCKENELNNDKCVLAIKYIKRCYTSCQNNRSFFSFPDGN